MKKQKNSQQNKKEKVSIKQRYGTPLKFIWQYIKYYKKSFIFVVVCSLLCSLIVCGIAIAEYYFMQFISSALDGTKTHSEDVTAILYFVFIIVFALISTGLYVSQTVLMSKVANYTTKSLRKDLYFKLLELKLQYFDTTPSGDIMSRLTNDINNISISLTQNVTQFLISGTQIIFFLIILFLFSPIMGVIAIVFTPIQLSVVYLLFKKAQPNFMKKQVALGEMNGFVEETVSGQKVINNFNKQDLVIRQFDEKNQKLRKIVYKSDLLSSLSNPWNTMMSNVMIVLMFIVGMIFGFHDIEFGGIVHSVSNGKSVPWLIIPLLTAIMSFSRQYINPIYQIFQLLNILQGAIAGIDRSIVVKNQTVEVNDKETVNISNIKGSVEFDNLTFSYDGKTNVLKNINLNIKPGQVVGIVGPTGSGKTTIINLLTKFYDVTNEDSDILIDGKSIKTITKHSLRKEVSIVLQDTFIFNASVYENMRYAKPDATDEEIIEAAKKANIHSYIMTLENGYDTVLTNNAEDMSQGQRQLLAIARAFLKQSSILILDEATSSVDTKTEKDIQSAMIELSKGKTTFMIAHRLSTIKHADVIIVLKDGQILEQGNHFELLKKQGFYANMYNAKLNIPEDI